MDYLHFIVNEFHLPLETEKRKCKDMKSRANVRAVKYVNRSVCRNVLILKTNTQELFKAVACIVGIALIFVPKMLLSKEG